MGALRVVIFERCQILSLTIGNYHLEMACKSCGSGLTELVVVQGYLSLGDFAACSCKGLSNTTAASLDDGMEGWKLDLVTCIEGGFLLVRISFFSYPSHVLHAKIHVKVMNTTLPSLSLYIVVVQSG